MPRKLAALVAVPLACVLAACGSKRPPETRTVKLPASVLRACPEAVGGHGAMGACNPAVGGAR